MFVFSGLAAAFCARCEGLNLFRGLGKNRSFLGIMALCALVQGALLYFGGSLFRTQPMSPDSLLRVLLLAASVVPADLLRKALSRR